MKFEIQTIELENFGMFQKPTRFSFSKGIWRVFGQDGENVSKSNGIGKSTIFMSIPYTLWGTVAKRKKADGVINKETKKNCMTAVEFSIDKTKYRVERYRKHHKYKNQLVLKTFENKKWNDVSLAEVSLTQEAIDKIVNINSDIFMKSILLSAETTPSFFELSTNDRHDLIESLVKLDFSDFEKKIKKRVPLFNKEVAAVRESIVGLKGAVNSIYRFISEMVEEKFTFLKQKRNKILQLTSELDAEITFSMNDLENWIAITTELKANKKQYEMLSQNFKTLQTETQNKVEAYLNTRKSLSKTFHDPTCAACMRPYDSNSKEYQTHLQRDEQQKQTALANKTKIRKAFFKQQEETVQIKTEMKNKMSEINSGLSKRKALAIPEEVLAAPEVWRNRVRDKEKILTKITELQASRWDGNKLRSKISEWRKLQAELEMFETKAAELAQEEQLLEYWKSVFDMKHEGNIKSYLIKKILPTFNTICNNFLDVIFDGKMSVAFDDAFDPTLIYRGSEYEYIDLSRGEKCKLNLCTNLTIFSLVRMNLVSTNILLLDEIFSGMEIESIEKFLNLFRKSYKDLGLYVISHERGMDELLDDAKAITIKKQSEFSSIIV